MTNLVQPRGDHYYKVFHCHGCQTCLELLDDDTVIQHEHILNQTDVTEEVLEWQRVKQMTTS